MAANEISLTIKLDEDDWKAIERAIMTIEKRIERIEAILDARGLDWDHPRVEDEPAPVDFGDKDHPVVMRQTMVFSLSQSDKNQPANEPPKKWRILEPGEVVQKGDWVNAKSNLPSDPPNGLGWKPAISAGLTVLKLDGCVFARPVADEPAKEPPEPEYREPVLPADAGKRCEFSISGKTWDTLELVGWNDDPEGWPWKSRLSNNDITCWKQCRIKKDA